MIRIYCDSNVYRILKPSHPGFEKGLEDMFETLKDKFIFCFSDAHLDDLNGSKPEYRDEDLIFMEKYVHDNYFMYSQVGEKGFQCFLATPERVFGDKNYDEANAIMENFSIDELFKDLDTPFSQILVNSLKQFYSLPVTALGDSFDKSTLDDKGLQWFNKFLPGYTEQSTIGEVISNSTMFGKLLLENEKEVTELRRYMRESFNPDKVSFDKWGLLFNDKFKEITKGKTFLETIDNMLLDSQKKDFYLRFSYAYSLLELFNITQERKSGGGLKKFTLGSLNTDSLHAYFASFCDYLITDDKGLHTKAKILYDIFGFPTIVLSTKEFSVLGTKLIEHEQNIETFFTSLNDDTQNAQLLTEKNYPDSDNIIRIYKPSHVYFNYFNRIQIATDKDSWVLTLHCSRNSHGDFFMYRESECVINKIVKVFGDDDYGRKEYVIQEALPDFDQHIIRRWTFEDCSISIEKLERENGEETLCLCVLPAV